MAKIALDKNDWVRGGPAENVNPPKGGKEVSTEEIQNDVDPSEIEPADPEKTEEAWNWNGGSPEIQSTGYTAPPTKEERIEALEKATGTGKPVEEGISSRIDDLEQRISDLESG